MGINKEGIMEIEEAVSDMHYIVKHCKQETSYVVLIAMENVMHYLDSLAREKQLTTNSKKEH